MEMYAVEEIKRGMSCPYGKIIINRQGDVIMKQNSCNHPTDDWSSVIDFLIAACHEVFYSFCTTVKDNTKKFLNEQTNKQDVILFIRL